MSLNSAQQDIPEELIKALNKNPAAAAALKRMPPSHQKEYYRYINEAKKEETRIRRAEKTIELLLQKAL